MNTNDLRVKRTLEAIKEAFIELVEKQGFDKITVKDIADKAKINRGTFYAHYQDKYDLLEKYEQELIEDIYKFSPLNRTEELKKNYKSEESQFFTLPVFEYLSQHFRIIRILLQLNNGISFQKKMKQFILNEFIVKNHHSLLKEENLLIQKEYLVAYSVSAHMGLIIEWMERDCVEPPEKVAKMLWTLAKYGTIHAVGLQNAIEAELEKEK